MIKKFIELFFDSTLGLLRQYQKKSFHMARVAAAAVYVQGVQALRKQLLTLFRVLIAAFVMAFALVVTPFFIVMLIPTDPGVKIMLAAFLGLIYILIPAVFLWTLFSEKKWMEISGSERLVETLTKKPRRKKAVQPDDDINN